MEETWISTKEAVKLTGYHIEYIRELIREDRVKGRKWGWIWQVDRDSLLAWKAEQDAKRKEAANE